VYQADLLDKSLCADIKKAIKDSAGEWTKFVEANRVPAFEGDTRCLPLAMKYQPSKWAKGYLPKLGQPPFPPPDPAATSHPTEGFWIGQKDFTWGKAVYVTGINEPLSTAPYGRVGLVSYFEPDKILKVFDARDQSKYELYLRWLQSQPIYPRAALTVHTGHWLHRLRNAFRLQFRIDVVMCNADEQDVGLWYTDPADTWLCVSDFEQPDRNKPGPERLKDNYSEVFPDVRLAVLSEEEFVAPDPDDPNNPRPPAWPPRRTRELALSGAPPIAPSKHDIAQAYWGGHILRVQS
jgi:hypothetical protein